MSRPLQAKLLRFLESGTFVRVGGNRELKVDVRLIAATNRDIVAAIREGIFREDLFHRLNVVQCAPPPLRERAEDIPLLAERFLEQFRRSSGRRLEGFEEEAMALLRRHHWPGNVRELRNAVERAVILETSERVGPGSLPDFKLESRLYRPGRGLSLEEKMKEFESSCIREALEEHRQDARRAASGLGLSPSSLAQRMKRLGIVPGAAPEA